MTSNRLMYDTCSTVSDLNQNAGTAAYILNTDKYENINKCRIGLGIVGGTNVSHIKGNLVDLESDLYGITRKTSLCPTKKYMSVCATDDINNCKQENIVIVGDTHEKTKVIDTDLLHLPTCQMVDYKPVVVPEDIQLNNIIRYN